MVAVQIVCQEADAALHRHGLRAHRQHFQLLTRQAGTGADITACENAESFETHLHFGQIFFILCRRSRTEPDGIAEVIQAGAGHDRIQIDHTKRFACFCIQQDVIQLGIVVCYAQRKLS